MAVLLFFCNWRSAWLVLRPVLENLAHTCSAACEHEVNTMPSFLFARPEATRIIFKVRLVRCFPTICVALGG